MARKGIALRTGQALMISNGGRVFNLVSIVYFLAFWEKSTYHRAFMSFWSFKLPHDFLSVSVAVLLLEKPASSFRFSDMQQELPNSSRLCGVWGDPDVPDLTPMRTRQIFRHALPFIPAVSDPVDAILNQWIVQGRDEDNCHLGAKDT